MRHALTPPVIFEQCWRNYQMFRSLCGLKCEIIRISGIGIQIYMNYVLNYGARKNTLTLSVLLRDARETFLQYDYFLIFLIQSTYKHIILLS